MTTSAEHEALVARFMKQRSKEEPDLVREVCERHPVLSDRQMRRREETEIPLSQLSSREARQVLDNEFYSTVGAEDE
jgi:hypothetical protein